MDIVNNFDLQMFAEGGATSSGVSAGTGDGGASDASATGDTAVTKSKRKAKADPFANVVFGRQTGSPEAAGNEEANAEGKAEGNKVQREGDIPPPSSTVPLPLGKGGNADGEDGTDGEDKPKSYTEEEFKQALDREMKRRYKGNDKKMAPILRYASEVLGVDLGDIDAMSKAADAARKQRYQDEAGRTGNDVATIERNADNAYDARNYREELKAVKEQNEAAAFNARMAAQEAEVKASYPEFDYDKEIADPTYRKLLQAGFSMKNAYESVHAAQIHERIRAEALREATDKVTASVAAGAQRPTEGGVTNPSAQVITDPDSLTKAQRAEIKKRVKRGEKIIW